MIIYFFPNKTISEKPRPFILRGKKSSLLLTKKRSKGFMIESSKNNENIDPCQN
jgi:hypothetical protein